MGICWVVEVVEVEMLGDWEGFIGELGMEEGDLGMGYEGV
jgi:hypothetical protein